MLRRNILCGVTLRILAWSALALAMLALVASPVLAAETTISSAGPLTQIIVGDTLSCQVAHQADQQFELFPPSSRTGDCGTFLALGGTVYGPSGGSATLVAWAPISQAAVAGVGSAADPFRIVTVVEATGAVLRLQQTDSYVVGTQSYRTDMQITNLGGAALNGILYRAGDCYLQESDEGYGRVDGGAPACIVDPQISQRIEQWLPITLGSRFFEGRYGEVWSRIASQELFPNTCACTELIDNGAGLSWPVSVAAGQSIVISHETFFSPVGRGPLQQSFTQSVPDPTRISLDPVVVASSVAIAAGVIVLVPFPSALFNSTLEENYEEVMGGVRRVRAFLGRIWAGLVAWVCRQIASRQSSHCWPADTAALASVAATVSRCLRSRCPSRCPRQTLPQPPAQSQTKPPVDLWRTPQGMLAFIVLSALVYGFLDPTFGLSLNSVAVFIGLVIGMLVVLLAYGVPLVLFARTRQLPLTVRALPATLLVGVACVLISRFANFQPGYLYGLVIGFFFARGVPHEQEGRAEAIAASVSLLVAFLAWVGLAFLRSGAAAAGDLTTTALQAASVTVVVAGLENAVFAMLPLRFLPGAAVYAWHRKVWIVLIGLGIFGFAHVLLNPSAGYLADTTRTSFLTLILLLVGFGAASVLFWAWFRFRPKRSAHP